MEKIIEILERLYELREGHNEALSNDPVNEEEINKLSKVNELIEYWEGIKTQLQEKESAEVDTDPMEEILKFTNVQYDTIRERRLFLAKVSAKLSIVGTLISSDLKHTLFGGTYHSLSGTITGSNGVFEINIIRAGGVNIARPYHRVTVKPA